MCVVSLESGRDPEGSDQSECLGSGLIECCSAGWLKFSGFCGFVPSEGLCD